MNNIRIEFVGDINVTYPYLEVFEDKSSNPFLDIGITDDKNLCFKFYASEKDLELSVNDIEKILESSKRFIIEALINAEQMKEWEKKQGNKND